MGQNAGDMRRHRVVMFSIGGDVGRGHVNLEGDIQPDHRYPPIGAKNKVGGFGVVADVGFGGGTGIARHQGIAAHQHDLIHPVGDARLQSQGQGDIGQRADWRQCDVAGMRPQRFDDERRRAQVNRGAGRRRQEDIALSVFAMYIRHRTLKGPGERMGGALGDWNGTAPGDFEQPQGINCRQVGMHIAENGCQADDLKLWRTQGEEYRHGVIDAGVGVYDDFSRHGLSSHHFDLKAAAARAIKLIKQDALRTAQQQLSLVNRQQDAVSNQRGFDMPGGVGRRVILMDKVEPRRHQPFDISQDIFGRGGVQR